MEADLRHEFHTDDIRLKEVYELSLLFDFYGELLGEHKKQIFEDYVLNDLSLAEIADEAGISRQGVHDSIKRCTKALRDYEQKLHLAEKFQQIKALVAEIKELSQEIRSTGDCANVDRIVAISDQILKQI